MKRKFPVTVLDCVAGICTALETDYHIRRRSKHIRDLTLAFVSPVCPHYCCDHTLISSLQPLLLQLPD